MKISELEALLKDLKERHGDLPVQATLGQEFTGMCEAEDGDLEPEMVRVEGGKLKIG